MSYELPGVGGTRNIKSLPWGHPARCSSSATETSLCIAQHLLRHGTTHRRFLVRWQHDARPTTDIKACTLRASVTSSSCFGSASTGGVLHLVDDLLRSWRACMSGCKCMYLLTYQKGWDQRQSRSDYLI
jgi:hypothetical protein